MESYVYNTVVDDSKMAFVLGELETDVMSSVVWGSSFIPWDAIVIGTYGSGIRAEGIIKGSRDKQDAAAVCDLYITI